MGRGGQFQPQQTGDALLTGMQGDIRDTFAQLEEFRRGLLVAPTAQFSSDAELGEQLFVLYTGTAGGTLKLPLAALRGSSKSQALYVMHGGKGTLTLRRAGSDTVNGGNTLSLTVGQAAVLASDGVSSWYAVTAVQASADGRDWNAYKHIPGGSGVTNHFVAGAATNEALSTAGTPTPNVLVAVPFIAPQRGGTLDLIGAEMTSHSAGAGNIIMGCYDNVSDSNLYPNALVSAQVGPFNTLLFLPIPGIASGTVSVALTPGKPYYFVYNADAGANGAGFTVPQARAYHTMFGVPTGPGLTATPNVAIQVAAFTYTGTLPATFPAGGFYTNAPGIGMRGRVS